MTDGRKPKAPGWLAIGTLIVLALIGLALLSSEKDTPPIATSTADTGKSPPPAHYGGAALNVTMSIVMARSGPLTVSGETNLPNGTMLSLLLRGDYPGCSPRCGFEFSQAVVQNGEFSAKLMAERDPPPGMYTVDVATAAGMVQPSNVQAQIGSDGEGLRGPFISALDRDGNYIPVNPEQIAPSQYLSGFLVHYTRRINIREDGSIDIFPTTEIAEAPTLAPSEAHSSQAPNSTEISLGAVETVKRFYDALSSADGEAAASYVSPERRRAGPLSGAELTARYSQLRTPLVVQGVSTGDDGRVHARYSYTASDGARCTGSSVTRLSETAGDLYIDEVEVDEKCQ